MDATEYVKAAIKWDSLFSMISSIGNSLNGRKERFDKADLIERGISRYSNDALVHIDGLGVDHFVPEIDCKVEVKYSANGLYSKGGKRKKTTTIKLTNTLGSSENRLLPNTFDYLLVLDSTSAAMIPYADLLNCIYSNGDGLVAKIDQDDLIMLVEPSDITLNRDGDAVAAYKAAKTAAINDFLDIFK